MAATLLLDTATWDLVLDASTNIAVAQAPYQLAQDASSAIRTFKGEIFSDTTQGIDYFGLVFGRGAPPLTLLKQLLTNAALTVAGIFTAQVFFTSLTRRALGGQVQVIGAGSSGVVAVPFAVAVLPVAPSPTPQPQAVALAIAGAPAPPSTSIDSQPLGMP